MSSILTAKGASKRFKIPRSFPRQYFDAVVDVDVELAEGKTLGVVGESGSGKTTLGRMIVGLEKPSSGTIEVCGINMFHTTRTEWRRVRPQVQMVFQDSRSSLDPRLTALASVSEPLLANRTHPRKGVEARAIEVLELCGLTGHMLQRYPHELSGGQRQRVSIARALVGSPRLLVLDEPTSALDVSVQAQVLNLLKDLQDSLGFACLFVSHDLAVVRSMSDEILVMRDGAVVEHGETETVFKHPSDDYTRRLLSAVPSITHKVRS